MTQRNTVHKISRWASGVSFALTFQAGFWCSSAIVLLLYGQHMWILDSDDITHGSVVLKIEKYAGIHVLQERLVGCIELRLQSCLTGTPSAMLFPRFKVPAWELAKVAQAEFPMGKAARAVLVNFFSGKFWARATWEMYVKAPPREWPVASKSYVGYFSMRSFTSVMTDSCTADHGRLMPCMIFTSGGKLTPEREGVTRLVSISFKTSTTRTVSAVNCKSKQC